LLRVINLYKIKNVCLSGGCFLNVKLNKLILDNITGVICVNPLSGDQGAAIGLYRKYTNSGFNFSDLCWGKRERIELHSSTKYELAKESIFVNEDSNSFLISVNQLLEQDMIVNIMQGNMEFGPRALCNTSTLALPSLVNAKYINKVNKRNEVMPMAPVMLEENSKRLLKSTDLDRVIGSNKFMIITHDFIGLSKTVYRGVLHNQVMEPGFTCRPQVIDNESSNIAKILDSVNSMCLINTSFNTHGRPILYTFADAINDFRKQKVNDDNNRLALVILNAK
jgi:carbamoyltransferase